MSGPLRQSLTLLTDSTGGVGGSPYAAATWNTPYGQTADFIDAHVTNLQQGTTNPTKHDDTHILSTTYGQTTLRSTAITTIHQAIDQLMRAWTEIVGATPGHFGDATVPTTLNALSSLSAPDMAATPSTIAERDGSGNLIATGFHGTGTAAGYFPYGITAGGTPVAIVDNAGLLQLAAFPTVSAAKGGTGLTAPGTTGNVLQSNGSAWASAGLSGSNFADGALPFLKTSEGRVTADGADLVLTVAAMKFFDPALNPINFGGGTYTIPSGQVPTAGLNAWILVYMGAAGVGSLAGTAAITPTKPLPTGNMEPLAYVYLRSAATKVYQTDQGTAGTGYVEDWRNPWNLASIPDGSITTSKVATASISQDKILEGAIVPNGGLTVYVNPLKKWNTFRTPIHWDGGPSDLTGHVPGSGLRRYVLIEINGTSVVVLKDGNPTGAALTDADMPTYDPGMTPLGFVALQYGQTVIAATDILPWRGPQDADASGGGSGTSQIGHVHGMNNESRVAMSGLDEGYVHQTNTPSMSVLIEANRFKNASSVKVWKNQTVSPTFTAPGSGLRIDALVLNPSSGSYQIVAGTADPTSPAYPAVTGNLRLHAYIHLRNGMSVIKDSDDGQNGYVEEARDYLNGGGGVSSIPVGTSEGGSGQSSYGVPGLLFASGTNPYVTVAASTGAALGLAISPTITPAAADTSVIQVGGGTIATNTTSFTNLYGLDVQPSTKTGSGLITNRWAARFAAGTLSTNDYGVQVVSPSRFGGTTAPTKTVDITGTLGVSGATLLSGALGVGVGNGAAAGSIFASGAGQASAAPSTALASIGGGGIGLLDSGSSAGNGGFLLFAGSSLVHGFAGIKALLTNSAGNTLGDLILGTHASTAATTLTEQLRLVGGGGITASVPVTVNGTAATASMAVLGSGFSTSSVDLSGWNAGNARVGMNAPTGNGNYFPLVSHLFNPSSGATATYERAAILARVQANDPAYTGGTYRLLDQVGVESQIVAGVQYPSLGRYWGFDALVVVPAANIGAGTAAMNGYAVGLEVGMQNDGGTAAGGGGGTESVIDSASNDMKLGLHINSSGLNPSTAALYINSNNGGRTGTPPGWYKGVFAWDFSITNDATASFLELQNNARTVLYRVKRTGSLAVGNGTTFLKQRMSSIQQLNIASTATATSSAVNFFVSGLEYSNSTINSVAVAVYPALPAGVIAYGAVVATNQIVVTIMNLSGSTYAPGAGTTYVRCTIDQYE